MEHDGMDEMASRIGDYCEATDSYTFDRLGPHSVRTLVDEATRRSAPNALACGVSRAEWHDKAWALFHAKTFDDTALMKVNIHTIRAVFDATYDALEQTK